MSDSMHGIPDAPQSFDEVPEKKKKTLWIILAIVAAILLLCCCIGVIVLIVTGSADAFFDNFSLISPALGLV